MKSFFKDFYEINTNCSMQSIVLVKINQWAIYKKYRYKKKGECQISGTLLWWIKNIPLFLDLFTLPPKCRW